MGTALRILGSCSLLLLTACAVGRDYETPPFNVEGAWDAQQNGKADAAPPRVAAADATRPWWERFADEALSGLVREALASNNDLKTAAARIAEARAAERQADAALAPQLDATGSVTRQTLGGAYGHALDTTRRYGANGSWEIDLFGGNSRRSEAARYGAEEAQAAWDQARLDLVSEVARNYIRLRSAQQQYLLVEKNLRIQEETLAITQAQRNEKMVSQLDVLRARAQAGGTRARLPQLAAETDAAVNRLAVLTAVSPKAMRERLAALAPIPVIPQKILADAPLETLRRRPDVRVAERRLAQATALSGAAFAEFFPKLTLEGFFGKSSSALFDSLTPWTAAASALMPLFNFGRIQAGVDMAEAREQQVYYGFRQAVLLAVEDVEVSLSAYRNEMQRSRELRQVAGEQREAVAVAREQYKAGIAPQLDLLDAQRGVLAAENDMLASEALAAEYAVRLYTALGGSEPVEGTGDGINPPGTPAPGSP